MQQCQWVASINEQRLRHRILGSLKRLRKLDFLFGIDEGLRHLCWRTNFIGDSDNLIKNSVFLPLDDSTVVGERSDTQALTLASSPLKERFAFIAK